jgi:hypothetical protein
MPTRGNNTLFDGGSGRMHGIFDPVLALLHFDLGRTPDTNNRDATRELCEALL